ncbi:MAG: GNAT family N-acetyltransferase [Rhodanobacteraceae bacterium]|nr:MAG: GNAT family N-acetyltransferase [Rhodanobacteraceae bacterium]
MTVVVPTLTATKLHSPSKLLFDEVLAQSDYRSLCENSVAAIAAAVRTTLLEDPQFLASTDGGVFTARDEKQVVLIAPRLRTPVQLPIRVGEKILCRLSIPSFRFHPAAQAGVATRGDAIALLRWLRDTRSREAIKFTEVLTNSPLYEALDVARSLGYHVLDNYPAPHLFHHFKDSYEAFVNGKPGKLRSQYRTKAKLFHERFGTEYTLKEYRLVDEVSPFLEAASSINKRTYQYRLFDEEVNNDTETRSYYASLAQRKNFRSFVLWHQSTPLCFILGSQSSDGIFDYRKTGYDPTWRECFPGINCTMQMLMRLYENDRPRVIDFGGGDARYKRLFATDVASSASPILLPDAVFYSPSALMYIASVRLNEVAIAILDRFGVKDRVKRVLRGKA